MFELKIEGTELFDGEEFHQVKPIVLKLEHSLLSISKWEENWKVPFLSRKAKTADQLLSYVQCMTINKNVDPFVYYAITTSQMEQIMHYIEENHTATIFGESENKKSTGLGKYTSSEEIYYQMFQAGIPIDCEKWNLSRLFAIIRIASIANAPKKPRNKKEAIRRRNELNAQRRAMFNTKG